MAADDLDRWAAALGAVDAEPDLARLRERTLRRSADPPSGRRPGSVRRVGGPLLAAACVALLAAVGVVLPRLAVRDPPPSTSAAPVTRAGSLLGADLLWRVQDAVAARMQAGRERRMYGVVLVRRIVLDRPGGSLADLSRAGGCVPQTPETDAGRRGDGPGTNPVRWVESLDPAEVQAHLVGDVGAQSRRSRLEVVDVSHHRTVRMWVDSQSLLPQALTVYRGSGGQQPVEALRLQWLRGGDHPAWSRSDLRTGRGCWTVLVQHGR